MLLLTLELVGLTKKLLFFPPGEQFDSIESTRLKLFALWATRSVLVSWLFINSRSRRKLFKRLMSTWILSGSCSTACNCVLPIMKSLFADATAIFLLLFPLFAACYTIAAFASDIL